MANKETDIIIENQNMRVELTDYITFWSSIVGLPSSNVALVEYLNTLLTTKQDLTYYVVATETDKESIIDKKTGTVAFVKATKNLYIYYNETGSSPEWIKIANQYDLLLKQNQLTSANAGYGINITGEGGNIKINTEASAPSWGNITGTLSNQADLQAVLDDKLDTSTSYGADLSYEDSQLQLLDQNGEALGAAVTIESSPAIDNSTITKNLNQQLQASSLVGLTSTVTELNYCTGVTSNIQTQLNSKISQAVDDSSTTSTTLGWSASKLNTTIGNIETLLQALR